MQDNTMKLSDGRTLGFADYGEPSATPIVLFHGTPGSRICGLDDDAILNRLGIRIVAPERPGYGLSDPRAERTILDWVADVGELADHLGLERFHVAGESGGGPYVLACAVRMPARVLSATLVGTACPPEALPGAKGMTFGNRLGFFLARRTPFLMRWMSADFAMALRKYPDKVMQRLISQLCAWDKRVLEESGEHAREVFLLHFQEAFRQGSNGHFVDSLLLARSWGFDFGEISVPVFMWHGECDTLMPIAPARELSKLIPGCECHFIPGAGHLLLESEELRAEIVGRLI